MADQEGADELSEEERAAAEEEARVAAQLAALKKDGVDLGIEDGEIASIQMRLEADGDTMRQENLIVPKDIMEPIHRDIAIRSGLQPAHDNLLAFAKPEAPNYLRDTATNMTRKTQRNIQPKLTEAQRTLIGAEIAERNRQRPPIPKVLNAEERMKNRDVIRKMQTKVSFLKNPRFRAEGKPVPSDAASPFHIIPEVVTFRNYEVGGVFEIPVELRNASGLGRHVRILPCHSEVFSHTPLRYDGENGITPSSVIAPGMAARFAVRFAPSQLNDQTDQLTIRTELGDFVLPVLARRIQPQLDFEEPVNIGNILAGQHASKTMTITNHGGEGSFRIVPSKEPVSEEEAEHYYETDNNTGLIAFRSPNFHIEPAAFYLEVQQTIEITIKFSATSTGQFRYPVLIEGDNGDKVPLTMIAISDAVRLEVLRWPTVPGLVAPRRTDSHESPWSLVPWQLNWLRPGAQVGCSESQAIEIANGGYLPVKVEWCLVEPPKALLSRLAVGGIQRLSDAILKDMHTWTRYDPSKHGFQSCPFTVSPASATLAPFSKATFTFAFYAYAPVDHCSTVFAYLAAKDLPASRHCLLHYNQLVQLQHMQPSGTVKGLPLFGGAVTPLVDTEPPSEEPKNLERTTSTCVVSAICLQGRSTGPKVVCLPPLVALSGDVLPFVSQEREIILANTGVMPACFSFRLTSQMPSTRPDFYDPLWVVAGHEVPPRPTLPEIDPEITDPVEILKVTADRLSAQWPPLPPCSSSSAMLPGFGALATIAIEPHKGRILPGQTVKIRLTLRVAQESDVDANLMVDLPASLEEDSASIVTPLRIRVLAAARAPRVEIRGTSFLDYGVVRAHDRHTLKLRLDNPSDMPTIVRLRHRSEKKQDSKDAVTVAATTQFAAEGPPTARSALGDAPRRQTPRDNPSRKAAKVEKGAEILDEATPEDEVNFLVNTYDDIVSMFRQALHGGDLRGAVPMEDTPEVIVEPWVNARSGCLEKSGRRKHQFYGRGKHHIPEDAPEDDELEGVGDEVQFIFSPECVALWPHQSVEVDVTLRTHFSEQYNALVEIVAFDSGHSQCIEATAEVQLPRLRLSTQHAHFPISYVKTHTDPYKIELFNDYDMPAEFHWNVPVKLEACIECQIDTMTGVVPPRSSLQLNLIAVPTREAEYAHLDCQVFVKDVIQPLALEVSARVYGPEVDYAVAGENDIAPVIIHKPRTPGEEPGGTYPILCGQAPQGTPEFDFGSLELLKPKKMNLVLYNRTGIPTPFGIKVDKNPAWDPLSKGKKIGGLLEAATRMYAMATTDSAVNNPGGNQDEPPVQTFSSEPHPVAGGRQPSLEPPETKQPNPTTCTTMSNSNLSRSKNRRFNPKDRRNQDKKEQARRWMLDDKHETQAFRNAIGAEFLKQKEVKEQGMVALKSGRGYAVSVDPRSDWLQPFSKATITCVCYSDVPGELKDELVISIGQLQSHSEGGDFRIPIRARSVGNPLFLPDQQVGLNNRLSPPQLLIETITPAAKFTTRTIKVGNNSMSQVRLTWKVLSQLQVQAIEQKKATPLSEETTSVLQEEQAPQEVVENAEATDDVEGTERVEETAPEIEATVETEVAEVTEQGEGEGKEGNEEQEGKDENAQNLEQLDEQVEATEKEEEPKTDEKTVDQVQQEPREEETPQIEDPLALPNGETPLKIEPAEAILPVQGMATFTVTLLASKATLAANGNYRYRLVGEGRYTGEAGALRNEEASANAPEVTHRPKQQSALKRGVAELPAIALDDNELHDDDSDIEAVPSGRRENEKNGDGETDSTREETRKDQVISTLIVDCTGDCVIPRLTVDKKGDPSVFQFADVDGIDKKEHCAVFKFVHSAVSQPLALPDEKHRGPPGVKLGGKVGGMQNQGIAAAMMREVTFNNENACIVYCRFRIEGPFRIKVVDQVGKKPVFPTVPEQTNKRYRHKEVEDALRQMFAVPARSTITLHVEYVPSMVPASEWTHNVENVFRGDLVVEYPRDQGSPDSITDLQRIHLHATSRKPAIRIDLVPFASLDPPIAHPRADIPPWAEQPPVLVEFGYVHVEAVIARKRAILLSNQSNVVARWRIFHVGRKRRPPLEIGVTVREDEDFRALDDREAFEFDVSEGELHGPSKDGAMPIYSEDGKLVRGGEVRMPNWCPTTPALPKRLPHEDEGRFDPRKLLITFKPTKNEVYKCRFRVQVEEGRTVDFICRGTGSYDEEDDAMDYQEA